MADYKKLYHIMCAAASKAMDEPPVQARRTLQSALDEAEELYIRTCGPDPEQMTDEAIIIPFSDSMAAPDLDSV